jgi:hypothetical protein
VRDDEARCARGGKIVDPVQKLAVEVRLQARARVADPPDWRPGLDTISLADA